MDRQDPSERSRERRRRSTAASWVVLATVVLIGVVATGVAMVQERRSADNRERAALDSAASALREAAATSAAALGGSSALVDGSTIREDRLRTFADDVAQVSDLEALGLVEVVTAQERAAIERRLGRSVFRMQADAVAPAADADQHWVVTDVVPDDELTSMLVGFDVLTLPLARDAAVTAAEGAMATLTEPVVLPPELAQQRGDRQGEVTLVFVFKPLFEQAATGGGADGADDATAGQGAPIGFLVSVVDGATVAESIAGQLPDGVRHRVTDGDVTLLDSGGVEDGRSEQVQVMGRTLEVTVQDDRPVNRSFSLLLGAITAVLTAVLATVIVRDRRRQARLRRVDAAVRGTASLARRLSAAGDVGEVVQVIERDVPPLVGATAAVVRSTRPAPSDRTGDSDGDPASALHALDLPDPLVRHEVPEDEWSAARVLPTTEAALQLEPTRIAALRAHGVRSIAVLALPSEDSTSDSVLVVGFPRTQPDEIEISTLGTVSEICEQALERAAATDRSALRAGALAALAEELARADDAAAVNAALLRSGRQPVGASAISVGVVDPVGRRLVIDHGDTVVHELSQAYRAPSLDEPLAFTDAARTGDAVLISSFEDYQERYPDTHPSNAQLGAGARAALPLAVGGEVIGAVAIAWDEERRFDQATRFSLATIAELTAQALHRVQLMGVHRDDAERSRALAGVAQRLAMLHDGPDLTRFVVDDAVGAVGAHAAALVVFDAHGWEHTASASLREQPDLLATLFGDGTDGAITRRVEGVADVHSGHAADADPLAELAASCGWSTSAVRALRDRHGRPLGGLWLGWRHEEHPGDEQRDVIDTLVGMTSQSVARCLLTDQLRADAERSERMAGFARRLANVTDVDELCRAVIDEAAGTVGATVSNMGLVDDTTDRLVVMPNHFFEDDVRAAIGERDLQAHLPGADTVRDGRPVLVRSLDEARQLYPGPVVAAMQRHGLRSFAHFPLLTADGDAIGCIGFAWDYVQPFRPTKLARLRTVAELCTQTLERVRLADAEHRLVGSLHRRVAGRTTEIDGVQLATRYLPATQEIGMGGDWYDAVALGPERCAVVVGDITGHGVAAVADMIELRAAIRSLLLNGVPLEHVFPLLSSSWMEGTSTLATACISVVDTRDRVLHHVSAGHIPALVRAPDGSVTTITGGRQPLLGVPSSTTSPAVLAFPEGSTMVMCTDGLIERRDRTIDTSIEDLVQALSSDPWPSDPEAQADVILDRCLAGGEPDDDVALVVLGLEPTSAAPGGGPTGTDADSHDAASAGTARPATPVVHEREFPATTESVGAARDFVRGAVPGASEDLILATSELVTNAVLHGAGPVTVRIERNGHGARLAVHDHGDGTPRAGVAEPDAEAGRGLGIVDALGSQWGTSPTRSGKWVWVGFDH